ncbi:MAG: hypothetical protein ACTS85_03905, partial [Arsenophonus sp. NC-PG7-MAG3]
QALLRGDSPSITIVPIYIGYEHVLEVDTYANELKGAEKEKKVQASHQYVHIELYILLLYILFSSRSVLDFKH